MRFSWVIQAALQPFHVSLQARGSGRVDGDRHGRDATTGQGVVAATRRGKRWFSPGASGEPMAC